MSVLRMFVCVIFSHKIASDDMCVKDKKIFPKREGVSKNENDTWK